MESQTLRHEKEGNTYTGSRKQELGLARWRSAVGLPEVLFDTRRKGTLTQDRGNKNWGWQGGGQPSAFLKFFLTCPGGETLCMSGGPWRMRSRTTVIYLRRCQLLHFIAVRQTGLPTQVSRDMCLYVKPLLYPGSKACGRPAPPAELYCRHISLCKHPTFSVFT